MTDSIARQSARWAAGLCFDDLPPEVVDKVKAFLLQHLVAAVFGAQVPRVQRAIELTKAEECKPDGATILVDGAKATRAGATYANTELMYAAGLYDYFRALTHPGPVLVSAALVNAELEGKSVQDVIVALAAGYEFACRLADDFVPSTAARGYRPASVFATMGAAVTAARLMDLDEDRMLAAIALAANSASGLNEAGRTGAGDAAIHLPHAARSGVFAAVMAREGGIRGSERIIEGEAGFYNAFTGSHTGRLHYAYTGPLQIDLDSVTAGLGSRYRLLTVGFHMYPLHGANQPVIDLIAEMKREHHIDAADVEELVVRMNYLETMYPSPEFPRAAEGTPGVSSTHYYAAHAAVNGGYPQVGGRSYGPAGVPLHEDADVLRFMGRVTVIGEHERPMFSPAIIVRMKGGTTYVGEYPYARMEWNLDQLVARLEDCATGYPLGRARFDDLVEAVRHAERMPGVDPLLLLTRAP